MHWISYLIAAAALYAGAGLTATRPASHPAAMLRGVARPLLLPVLWHGLARAQQRATPGELMERGRFLLRFLPQWIEGHIFLASQMAFDASIKAEDTEAKLDRLSAAVLYLEQTLDQYPARGSEILVAMAFFIDARTRQDPELAAAFRAREGIDPRHRAAQLLRRAYVDSPLDWLGMRVAFQGLDLVIERVDAKDRIGASERLKGVLEILAEANDREAADLISELEFLKRALDGGPKNELEALKASRFRQVAYLAERLLR